MDSGGVMTASGIGSPRSDGGSVPETGAGREGDPAAPTLPGLPGLPGLPPAAGQVPVLLPLPFDAPLTYAMPEDGGPEDGGPGDADGDGGEGLPPGTYVRVPLGPRETIGVVWDSGAQDVDPARLRPLAAIYPTPPMPPGLRRLIDFTADYTLCSRGAALRLVLRDGRALVPPPGRRGVRLDGPPPERMTAARQAAIDHLLAVAAEGSGHAPAIAIADLAAGSGASAAVIGGLIRAGTLVEVPLTGEPAYRRPDTAAAPADLSDGQAEAAQVLADSVGRGFSVTVLDGVTGSGKTEVYFAAVRAALLAGRQVLVMVPEIALSTAWLERFTARFGTTPAVWHSEIGQTERRRLWRAAALGNLDVVVGARSSLFLPLGRLGLIVVDEEHDASYKQDDGVAYNARDLAVVRGKLEEIPVVLSSATPSLETLTNVARGRYARVVLPARHGQAAMPAVEAVDLRRFPLPASRFLAPPLVAGVAEALAAGEQALLFLNRRGFAPLTLCDACGHRLQCPHCSAWLVEHRLLGRLQCHHCGHAMRLPPACPECGVEGRFKACGPGVERLMDEAKSLFPEARIALASSDSMQGPRQAADLFRAIHAREIDLIVGTQVLAKGHHFPWLTCVGVVDADLGLEGGDLRAGERSFQMLTQVAGRAGRAERPGRVFLQTHQPEHPVMAAMIAHDRDGFIAAETGARRSAAMPPFGRLASVLLSGPDEPQVAKAARMVAGAAPRATGLRVLGPAPAPLSLLRGRFRWRLLLHAARHIPLQPVLRTWLGPLALPAAVRLSVDVDPYNFL